MSKVYEPFRCKEFTVEHDRCAMKVGSDGMLLGAWAQIAEAKNVLDIGTGSGIIALMLAQRAPQLQVLGIEIDPSAAQQAAENAKGSRFAAQIQIAELDLLKMAAPEPLFDLIVSNPPFFSGGVLSYSQARNDVRQTSKLAHGDLIRSVKKLLAPHGRFSLVLPVIEALRFEELAATAGLWLIRRTAFYGRKDKPVERYLMEFSPTAITPILDTLCMYEGDTQAYTQDYIQLMKAFYIHM